MRETRGGGKRRESQLGKEQNRQREGKEREKKVRLVRFEPGIQQSHSLKVIHRPSARGVWCAWPCGRFVKFAASAFLGFLHPNPGLDWTGLDLVSSSTVQVGDTRLRRCDDATML